MLTSKKSRDSKKSEMQGKRFELSKALSHQPFAKPVRTTSGFFPRGFCHKNNISQKGLLKLARMVKIPRTLDTKLGTLLAAPPPLQRT